MNETINKIVDLIKTKKLVIFTGAGISMAKPSDLFGFADLQNNVIWALCQGLEERLKKYYEPIFDEVEYGKSEINSEITNKFLKIPPEHVFQICKNEIILENQTSDNNHE